MRFISFRTVNALAGLTLLVGTNVAPVLAETNTNVQPQNPVHQHHQRFWNINFKLTEAQKAQLKQIIQQEKAALRDTLKVDRINKLKMKSQYANRQKAISYLNTASLQASYLQPDV